MRAPSRLDLLAARSRRLPDVWPPGLRVLFCGINPGLYSTAVGHHFGRPGNRFWPALHQAGFTERRLAPDEDGTLPERGLGITNLCPRTTARADELDPAELRRGARALARKLRRRPPAVLAVLGVGAYRMAFGRPRAALGLQPETAGGVPVFVLPNPSGLNAHYSLRELARWFLDLRRTAERLRTPSPR
jgi:TDG/mug DNA glycosylase family protein